MCKQLMWRELKALNQRWGFQMEFNETSLIASMPSGSRIWLLGASHADDIARLRGHKYPLVCLDESASFGSHIEELVVEVVEPALLDYDGTLVLAGTPGRRPTGLFYEVTSGFRQGWSTHKWSLLQNPHMPEAARDLALIRARQGLSEEDPRYRREYLGEWVLDDSALVYRYGADRNIGRPELTSGEWFYNLGVDLGYDDDTAFVVGAFSSGSPNYYIVECFKKPGMIVSDVAREVGALSEKYQLSRKVCDSGGLGKMIIQELNIRYGLGLLPAEKKDKLDFIEHMNSDMMLGRVKVYENCPLIEEWKALPWNDERDGENPNHANHLADACLYAWRDSKHFSGKTVLPGPEKGSAEWFLMQERLSEQRAIENWQMEQGQSWLDRI
jgi:hypothetical protein